jgi:hypothetical protein
LQVKIYLLKITFINQEKVVARLPNMVHELQKTNLAFRRISDDDSGEEDEQEAGAPLGPEEGEENPDLELDEEEKLGDS